ncbi:hypothetical protein BGW80DRAFT_788585 [Lactifluus volemus]|nr:hypothetical protein BGW80DRAFT_788585 [Lactifluus volemus]
MSQTLSAQDTSLQKSEGSTKQDSSTTSNTSESYIHSSSIPTIDGVAKGDDDVTSLAADNVDLLRPAHSLIKLQVEGSERLELLSTVPSDSLQTSRECSPGSGPNPMALTCSPSSSNHLVTTLPTILASMIFDRALLQPPRQPLIWKLIPKNVTLS